MDALRAKKRQDKAESSPKPKKKKKPKSGEQPSGQEGEKGYDSGDTYDSGEYQRTKEDNDFIDIDDDDPDAINELYAEQHFDDERPDDEDDEEEGGRKKKKAGPRRARGPDALSDDDKEDESNPIMMAVNKMKRKKRTQKKLSELEEEAKIFLNKMEAAAEDDEKAFEERRPATKKLSILPEVLDMLTRRDMMRLLLDFDVLNICKRWIKPLPSGGLGNVTVRQRLLEVIFNMNGEHGIVSNDLKRSAFGKVVMSLYMHKSETPTMKRQLKTLIEQWSRPIFQKSGNMRDLEHVHASRGDTGLVGISRAQQQHQGANVARKIPSGAQKERDLHSIIASGSKGGKDSGSNRVHVPFSKGFQFTVRPTGKTGYVGDKRMAIAGPNDKRAHLSKRMIEKGRAANKNQRSANISIEGRPTK